MSFEFTLLDALQALRCPVLDALAVFFDQAGAHGEIWIAFTVVLLAFRRTRRAGLAMALALGLYMLAGHCALKPLFARPRPCDLRPEMLTLVARPHGWSFPSGHTSSAFAAAFALWLQNRRLGVPALALAGFIGFTRMYLSMAFGCGSRAPHGGIFVIGIIDHGPMFLLAILIGAVVGMAGIVLLKKPLKAD